MATATIFKGFNKPVENKSLIILTKEIQQGTYKSEVEAVRLCLAQGNTAAADKLKKKLLAFTPSATFEGGRKINFLVNYSQFIILDLDKLQLEELTRCFAKIIALPYTFCCFRSPGNNGLKILIEVTSDKQHHLDAYNQVADFYEKEIQFAIDRSGKDITRLCFVSYDPDSYRNIANEKFKVPIACFSTPSIRSDVQLENIPKKNAEGNEFELAFEMQISFTNQKSQYQPNNRNNYIFLLSSNCNRTGIPEQETLQFCLQKFDLDEREIRAAVKSAYQSHTVEFAKFANQATPNQEIDVEDYLKNTFCITDHLYDQMPQILKEGALAFGDKRERDVFLTGALGILSGCLPNVKGNYGQQDVYPNLFTFAIAPAASGKGALKFAKQLADEYHTQVLTASKQMDLQFQLQDAAYKQKFRTRKKNDPPADEPPVKPAFKVVYIPANTSYAKILSHLEQNEGAGIICETEADTLGNVFKQEWGSYSDMLRKAFHHERLSSSRKTNNEFTEVNEPCLSIALSGTPNQVTGLIASSEDGLFSRFIFYAFKVEQDWKDVSPYASTLNLTAHFKNLSMQVYDMVKFLKLSETTVVLSSGQWQQLNTFFKNRLSDTITFTSEDAGSVVKRLGLISYRIAMLFTAMRKFENAEVITEIECTDVDFSTALSLADIYLHHSILMFHNLPKQNENELFQTGSNKRKLFDELPKSFSRAEAVALGNKYHLSPRSVDELLRNATPALLSKLKAGYYEKV